VALVVSIVGVDDIREVSPAGGGLGVGVRLRDG
jgi:hypothetical protein